MFVCRWLLCILALAALMVLTYAVRPIAVRIDQQRVDYHDDLVIDTPRPHLSWQLEAEMDAATGAVIRGVTQSAYRITVTSVAHTRTTLRFDSDKVASASADVTYSGPPLQRDSAYQLTMQYWSSTGAASAVVTARFRTAMFDEFDASALWIGSNDVAMNQLRKEFAVPSDVVTATVYYSGIGHGVLYVNGNRVDPSRRNDPGWTTYEKRTFYVSHDVTSMLTPGAVNAVGVELGYGWYSQEEYWNGQSEPAYGPPRLLFNLVLHSNNTDVSVVSDTSWMGRTGPRLHDGIYMGIIYDARLQRDGWSRPGFTDPLSLWINASLLTSPIDSVISSGGPCVVAVAEGNSAQLSCGNSTITSVVFASFGTPQGSCGNQVIGSCHANNSAQIIASRCVGKSNCTIDVSVGTWGFDPCPGTAKDLSAQVNCSGPAPQPPSPSNKLVLQPMDPIRIGPDALHIETSAAWLGGSGQPDYIIGESLMNGGILKPVSVGGSGHQVFDFGQNFAGFCMFNVSGPRAIAIHFRHGEILSQPTANGHAYGDIFTSELYEAAQTDIFVLAGTGQLETFEAEMTSHGFRYVSVLGYNLDAKNIQCFRAHSETTLVGNFTSSVPVINQIQHNIQWGQLSNSASLPSDCPQRNERKGWLGDAALSVDESLYNFDYHGFYANFLDLIHDIQNDDGTIPDTVPFSYGGRPADPNWGTAYVQITAMIYNHYGDEAVIRKHYDGIRAYVEYVRGRYVSGGGLVNMFVVYGDWIPPTPYPQTNGALISSFAFLRDVWNFANMSALVGNEHAAREYTALYKNLTVEWHKTWYNDSAGGYADNMQSANALSLWLPGLVPESVKDKVVRALVSDIESKGHFTTGMIGLSALFPVLSMNGYQDLAVRLASSIDYPSYGYMFNNMLENATTLWEAWDAPDQTGFVASRNHHMFSSIGAWFYRYLAGIDMNAFNDIIIHPILPFDMTLLSKVSAQVVSRKGAVLIEWEREADGATVTYKTTVPTNTHARISFAPAVPNGKVAFITESNVPIFNRQRGVLSSAIQKRSIEWLTENSTTRVVTVRVGGGRYEWVVVWQ